MRATRKFIQTIRFCLGAAVVIYLVVILRLPSSATPNPIFLRALGLVSITLAILIFVMRRILVKPAEAVLETQPEDKRALARLRAGFLITYALALSIALHGLVLHFV